MIPLNYSQKESKRFKMNIYRGSFESLEKENLKELKTTIIKNDVDTVVLRIPVEELSQISKIEKVGFPYIIADTLVYYYVDFDRYEIKGLKNNDLKFVKITTDRINALNKLVETIFNGYTNHYNSNPFFDMTDINEGYKEWARNLIDENKGKIGWIIQRNNEDIGFATCSFDDENNIGEGVLYGVIPTAAGGGVYTDIIRFTQKYFKEKEIRTMKVSTQIQNYAVQKVWSREGFVLKKALNTIHINSLLSFTSLPEKELEIIVTEEEINNFGKVSGDMNPIHFDNDYAKSIGMKGRITHGLIANSVISKYFGTEYPGNGTLFLSYRYNFYRPIYPNTKYKMNITFPFYNSRNETYLAVVKIKDLDNNLCLLSYNDLIKR